MPIECVLDSSALLAQLLREPGADIVANWNERSCMSLINVTEVVSRLVRSGVPLAQCWEDIEELDMPLHDYDELIARRTTSLAPLGWQHGLSLGDRACIATAAHLGLTVVTADKKWTTLDLPCPVVCIR